MVPRPLDIHKKLPIVKSIKDLDIEDASVGRASHVDSASLDGDCENLVLTPAKKAGVGSKIPTPQYLVVDSYKRDYTWSFVQPPSYIRGRPGRSENAEYCEYDLDSHDEHWLLQFNSERKILPPEKFEMMLYKLEIMDQKAAEKQGSLVPVLGSPIPIVLTRDSAIETVEQEEDSVNIDMSNIFDHDPDFYAKIVRYPLDIIPLLDTECQEVAIDITPNFEEHIEARPFNLRASMNMRELNPSEFITMCNRLSILWKMNLSHSSLLAYKHRQTGLRQGNGYLMQFHHT